VSSGMNGGGALYAPRFVSPEFFLNLTPAPPPFSSMNGAQASVLLQSISLVIPTSRQNALILVPIKHATVERGPIHAAYSLGFYNFVPSYCVYTKSMAASLSELVGCPISAFGRYNGYCEGF
jgi:hypothetical protein